jgi:hypothetical protein
MTSKVIRHVLKFPDLQHNGGTRRIVAPSTASMGAGDPWLVRGLRRLCDRRNWPAPPATKRQDAFATPRRRFKHLAPTAMRRASAPIDQRKKKALPEGNAPHAGSTGRFLPQCRRA